MRFPEAETTTEDEVTIPGGHLLVLVGPTAVGKTEIAIQLALRLSGEIISADSRLFYRGMDIGTAKPSMEERRGIPHHLIDIADPDETLSLAIFQQLARRAINEVQELGQLPILVGGTGQYIRAVTRGWVIPPVKPTPRIRAALEAWGNQIGMEGLHARLAVLDPEAAMNIDPRNQRRTIRALEVILTTGQLFSALRGSRSSPYRLIMVGLRRPRPELYARIDSRIDGMIQAGFVQEVRTLLDQGYSPELPALSAIGYREIIAYLQGKLTLEQAVSLMKRKSRIFVRRQANWFKADDPQIHWFDITPATVQKLETLLRSKL